MTAVQPGWYADPAEPGDPPLVRRHRLDGPPGPGTRTCTRACAAGLVAATAALCPDARRVAPAPARSGSGRAVIIAVSVVGGFFALSILAAIAIPVFLNQRALAELSALSTVTCESLGDEAVAYSQAEVTGDQIPLASVSGLTVAQDDRATVRRPTTGNQAFVMSCAGTGLWQDGVTTPVVVELSIDSAVEHVVSFTWDEPQLTG